MALFPIEDLNDAYHRNGGAGKGVINIDSGDPLTLNVSSLSDQALRVGTGYARIDGGIRLDEQADHPIVGASGFGVLWARSSDGALIWTNSSDVDNDLVGGGGGNTLDGAYDQGGAGAGRTITTDSGAVSLQNVPNTGGTYLTLGQSSPISAEGTHIGIDVDFDTNFNAAVTVAADITNTRFITNTVSIGAAVTVVERGLQIDGQFTAGGAFNITAAGIGEWQGIEILMPRTVDQSGGGTLTATGLEITGAGEDSQSGTQTLRGIRIAMALDTNEAISIGAGQILGSSGDDTNPSYAFQAASQNGFYNYTDDSHDAIGVVVDNIGDRTRFVISNETITAFSSGSTARERVYLTAENGGSGLTGVQGGGWEMTAGSGGDGLTGIGGFGGDLLFTSGDGGDGPAGAAGGTGGQVTLLSGSAGASGGGFGANGGSIVFQTGTSTGTGVDGTIIFVPSGTQIAEIDSSGISFLSATQSFDINPVNRTGVTSATTGIFTDWTAADIDHSGSSGTFAAWAFQPPSVTGGGINSATTATVYIAGAPTDGGGHSIFTPYSLWVDAGDVRFDGSLRVDVNITVSGDAIITGEVTLNDASDRIIQSEDAGGGSPNRGQDLLINGAGGGGSGVGDRGGDITHTGGDAGGTGDNRGGNINLVGGSATGAGVDGTVNITGSTITLTGDISLVGNITSAVTIEGLTTLQSGIVYPIRTVSSSNATITTSDYELRMSTGATDRTVDLPTASGNDGQVFIIKKVDSGAGVVTVDGNSSETIDGSLTLVLSNQYDWVSIISDGTNWDVIG